MKKVLNFLKRNIAIHMVVGAWLGVMGAVYVIYSNAEVSSGLSAGSVAISKTNMEEVPEATLQSALDYLYEKASHVGESSGCPEEYECFFTGGNPGYLSENDSNTYEQSEFIQSLNVGDLIRITPVVTSVRLDGFKSGYSGYYSTTTYLNPNELQYWRVINKNANGTVDVVSEYVSSVTVEFYGGTGYANLVGYLNELASYYENPMYTIGSRMMGYNGQTQYITNTSKFDGTYEVAPWQWSTQLNTSSEDEVLGAGDFLYQTDYDLIQIAYTGTIYDTDNTITTDQAKAYVIGTTNYRQYFLTSRYYYFYSSGGTGRCQFKVNEVNNNGTVGNYPIHGFGANNSWTNTRSGFYLRPILTLKADITNTSTETGIDINGTTSAYVLG